MVRCTGGGGGDGETAMVKGGDGGNGGRVVYSCLTAAERCAGVGMGVKWEGADLEGVCCLGGGGVNF